MQKYLLLLLLCGTALLNAQAPAQRLKNVKAVYVALEGDNKGDDPAIGEMIRSKIIGQVAKIQGLSVVEDESDADAILTGAAITESRTNEIGRVHYFIHGGMRLVSKTGNVVLWADDVSSGRYARSASSSFAENIAKKLGEAFAASQKN
jgi:TolB-like protein